MGFGIHVRKEGKPGRARRFAARPGGQS